MLGSPGIPFSGGFLWWVCWVVWAVVFVWAVYDVTARTFKKDIDKALWLAVVLLGGPIGDIIYLVVGRHKGTLEPW